MASEICDNCKYLDKSKSGGTCSYDSYWCRYKQEYVGTAGYCYHFAPGGGGCYLTAACVEYQGKTDDCEELTALRNFRDTYMKATEDGQKLVEEYYAVAPEIVKRINSSDKKELYYRYISGVIDKCVNLISHCEYERTTQEYKSMVIFLKKEFNL